MRILVICANASSNSLVRVYPIAKVLERRHEVIVAGYRTQDGIFAPYASEFDYLTARTRPLPGFLRQIHAFVESFDADLVYAFKPLSTSLWPGLVARNRWEVPLVVDIEDWELGWYLDRPVGDRLKHLRHLREPNSLPWTALNELLVRRADHRFVVSRSLQRRFGGTILRHGPDTAVFSPDRWSRGDALTELGLPDLRYVLFAGSVMRNKGLEAVLESVRRIGRPDVKVLLVGASRHDPQYHRHLQDRFGEFMTVIGPQPHEAMPMFLAAASLVVLAQRRSRETSAQIPGKVFEAMAMARPVIATAVSDLPEILEGCGVVIPPDDSAALEGQLASLLEDDPLAHELGAAARERCVAHYSWDAMERILDRDLQPFSGAGSG